MKHKKTLLPALAALLLLAVFATGVLGTLLGGAGIYRRLTLRDRASYDSRTCLQYIATRVRQAPSQVRTAVFGDGDALVISETVEHETYLTRVYCHDGWLMELFTISNGVFAPEDGEKILPLQKLTLSLDGSLISVSLTDSDTVSEQLTLHIRGSGGNSQ